MSVYAEFSSATPDQPRTLVDLFFMRVSQCSDQVAYTFFQDDEEVNLTYAALGVSAQVVAGWLHAAGYGAGRVLVCCPSGSAYVLALYGCLCAGVTVVPVAAPDPARLHRTLVRFRATLHSAQPALAMTTRAVLAVAAPLFDELPELRAMRWVAIEDVLESPLGGGMVPRPTGDSLAVLMYTSGSTAAPKGVMVSHRNILHNAAAFPGFQARPCRAIVSWLPLYHDLGFFMGVVHPLYQGVPALLLDAVAFVQRPVRWLQAISRAQATTSAGPNFAYDLCVRKVLSDERALLDLRSWNLALNGAEPIRDDVLERFAEAFLPCGFRAEVFYPSYGMADATATVSGGRDVAPPRVVYVDRGALQRGVVRVVDGGDGGRALVGCGQPLVDQTTLIVNPDVLRACAPDEVGEVWLAGPSVTQGYWNQPDETRRVFQAYLVDTGAGPFFRTGDLGFLRDGELFLVGRLKDMLVFRGQNHYSEDIELTVERSHVWLRPGCGAAFAVEGEYEERLVVVHELDQVGDAAQLDAVVERIRQAVIEYHDVHVSAVCLIAKGSLPKTSSGKIARHACRAAYEQGQLPVVYVWHGDGVPGEVASVLELPAAQHAPELTVDAVAAWLMVQLSMRLNLPLEAIDLQRPFTHYDLDSVQVVALVGDLERWLGRGLHPTLLWDYPHIAALAHYLASSGGAQHVRLGDVLVASRFITVAQLEAALEEQRRSLIGERLGEVLVRLNVVRPDQVYAALLRQRGVAEQVGLFATMEVQEHIAIIGMGCRFPGARDLGAFWELLCEGRDAITEVPQDRWDVDALFDVDRGAPGKMYTRWGGFLEGLDAFDAAFMEVSPREAAHLDPQQRLLMEVVWEALEDAGVVPEHLANSQTGVFVSSISDDYSRMVFRDLSVVDAYSGTGGAHSILANRLSYVFNLRGPSVALDTACSGALVAVHLACQSLRRGESSLAIAGGVNVNLLPDGNIFFSKAGALSPDGRCKTFDARADGIVRSEGVGVVVLKPLGQALADGNEVYAVIRGSAVNSDGRTNGMMAPNRQSQEAVLQAAYRDAGVPPQQVAYVEAHGTGTRLGDVIEAQALGAVVGEQRAGGVACRIGSVKSNIGHTEAAAGAASIIKVALALRHGLIPPSIHFQTPNPMIPFDALGLEVQQALTPWPGGDGVHIAGVSGFGFGGTNAHVVLGGGPWQVTEADEVSPVEVQRPFLLPLSAKSAAALRDLARSYHQVVAGGVDEAFLRDVCFTVGVGRAHHAFRLAVVGQTVGEVAEGLGAFVGGEVAVGVMGGDGPAIPPRSLVFVFSGQGSHWVGMGRALLEREPVFAAVLREVDGLLRQYVRWSLVEELWADAGVSRLNETEVTQPAIFAVQVGLAALWRSWGVVPDVVVGHSLGEAAAAYVAGALSLDDAVRVIYHRSRLMARMAGLGKTAAVELSMEEVLPFLAGREALVAVAGSNSPTSSVLSGDPGALGEVVAELERRSVFCRVLRGVDIAFHSPQMDGVVGEFVESLRDLVPMPSAIPIVSTVTGGLFDGVGFDAGYWGRNLREPFLFTDATRWLLDSGYRTFLEVSPHPVLVGALVRSGKFFGQGLSALPSLRNSQDAHASLFASLGALYTFGVSVAWRSVFPVGRHRLMLPTYAWQRERFWLDQLESAGGDEVARWGAARRWAGGGQQRLGHPLLGEHVQVSVSGQHVFEVVLSTGLFPFLGDHRVQSMVVLPGAAFVEMALAAGAALAERPWAVQDVVFKQALFVPDRGGRRVQVVLTLVGEARAGFQVASCLAADDGPPVWTVHATGVIDAAGEGLADALLERPADVQGRCTRKVASAEHYEAMEGRGLWYGPRFQAIMGVWARLGEAVSLVELPREVEGAGYVLHPILLDAAFQLVAATLPPTMEGVEEDTFLPVGVRGFRLFARPGGRLWCHAVLRSAAEFGRDSHEADVWVWDGDGEQVVARVVGLRLQRLSAVGPQRVPGRVEDWVYRCVWQPLPGLAKVPLVGGGTWVLLVDAGGVGVRLRERLVAGGGRCVLVVDGLSGGEVGPDVVVVDRSDVGALGALFKGLAQCDAPLRVVYLWGLDAQSPSEDSVVLEGAYRGVCGACVAVVQAMVQQGALPEVQLWLVTCGAQVVGDSPSGVALMQVGLWGIGRVLLHEHPELQTRLVDVDAGDEGALDALVALMQRPGVEDQVVIRQGGYFGARLVQQVLVPPVGFAMGWRADGSYLITGGMGGLGLAVARAMVQQGARRLILMGRTALPARGDWQDVDPGSRAGEVIAAIRGLEALGASVHVAVVDVADAGQVGGFLAGYRREGWPPIRGVIHAAGVLHDQLVARMEGEVLGEVLRPKVGGAWVLHCLLRDEPLDVFVCFSSLASVLGSMGQANYAAGNAFLDALVHYRRAQGLCALAVNWGPWAEVGMAARAGVNAFLAAQGMAALTPEQGTLALQAVLAQGEAQVTVVAVDWGLWRGVHPVIGSRPFFAGLGVEVDEGSSGRGQADSTVMDALRAAGAGERRGLLVDHLQGVIARVLRMRREALAVDRALYTLGLDSIICIELKNSIEASVQVVLSLAYLLQGPSVNEIADEALQQLERVFQAEGLRSLVEGLTQEEQGGAVEVVPLAEADADRLTQLLDRLDQLSPEEVRALLDA